MKIFIAGTFDNFHVGHQYLCWSVYEVSADMVIVLARDTTVKRIKGHFPRHTEQERLMRVASEFQYNPNVRVRLGNADGDFLKTLKEEAPTHLWLGYDQQINLSDLEDDFSDLIVKRANPYQAQFFKSSKFFKKKFADKNTLL